MTKSPEEDDYNYFDGFWRCGRADNCGLAAGWGTDHVGVGACKLHGGASPTGEDNPAFKHGLFSDYLDDEDQQTAEALTGFDDAEKLEELVNWRLARLRRYLREMSDEDEMTFWDAFREVLDATETVEDDEIRALAQMLDKNNRAVQEEI
ncbi:MAG: hypothetical protein ACOCP2_03585, partial [Halohasta sp.]